MRTAIYLIGIILIGAGAAIGFGNFRYPDETSIVKIGNVSATLTRQRPIPHWLGAVTALTGLLIVGLGTRYRR